MKKHLSTIILVVVLLAGLSLLLYPTVSDYYNSFHQSKAIAGYVEAVDKIDDKVNKKTIKKVKKYNKNLLMKPDRFKVSEKEHKEYEKLMDVTGTGIMAYVEIPAINVSLPIYHGTDEEVLQIGVGHIEGTSLPMGGENTHCVISGHRGLTSSKLFTDIDQLVEGDVFMLYVMGETLTYQVDQIHIVLPHEMGDLNIESGKDYCTLLTCTPYGVNTHRLLVRGHRIENAAADGLVVEDAKQINPLFEYLVVGIVLLLLYILVYKLIKSKILFYFE